MNLETIFFYLGIIGTIIFLIKTTLPVDFDCETQSDFTTIADSDTSFNLFTIESISAFLMTSGWMGWITKSQLHLSTKTSLAISIVAGFVAMFVFSFAISQIKKLQHIPKADLNELLGKKGKAYMRFLPKNTGKIQIEFNSKLEILDARNISEIEIQSFEPVKVVKIENDEIFIEKDI